MYGVSPWDYKCKRELNRFGNLGKLEKTFNHSHEKYRNRTRLTVVREQKVREVRITADVDSGESFANPWEGMVHFGSAGELLSV